ncbi:MAG TPA: hypothetical protein VJ142_01280 [Candidatus Nanoarchaeia archaeon]|nr:hypothetical protein [Candidatus Nanoarchaeia archaeon]
MTAEEELRKLVTSDNYTGRATSHLARFLRQSIERGEINFNGSSGFYVPKSIAYVHGGLLIRSGLIRSVAVGGIEDGGLKYFLTDSGVRLGRMALEESAQKDPPTR